jgi:hypothetical protein
MYSSVNNTSVIKSRRTRWEGHVAWMGGMINIYKIVIGEPEGKKQFGRSKSRREDNIRIDVREIGSEGVDWIYLAQDRDQ